MIAAAPHVEGRLSSTLRRLVHDPWLLLSLIVGVVFVAVALAAPAISPFDPGAQDLSNRLAPPLAPRLGVSVLGADPLGRDMLSRIVYSARVSMLVAVSAVLLAGSFGVALGLVAGYFGGAIDALTMRLADVQLSIPFIVLALSLAAVVGPGLINVIVVLGLSSWVAYARVVRAEALSIRQRDYVLAAKAVGASTARIIVRHVFPNAAGAASVIATIELAHMIISEASLSFLGLGVPTSIPTWGSMVADGRPYISTAWWVSAFPGLAIVVFVVALNVIGDWLGDVANPTLRTD